MLHLKFRSIVISSGGHLDKCRIINGKKQRMFAVPMATIPKTLKDTLAALTPHLQLELEVVVAEEQQWSTEEEHEDDVLSAAGPLHYGKNSDKGDVPVTTTSVELELISIEPRFVVSTSSKEQENHNKSTEEGTENAKDVVQATVNDLLQQVVQKDVDGDDSDKDLGYSSQIPGTSRSGESLFGSPNSSPVNEGLYSLLCSIILIDRYRNKCSDRSMDVVLVVSLFLNQ